MIDELKNGNAPISNENQINEQFAVHNLDIVVKISDRVIKKWGKEIEPFFNRIMKEGVEYIDKTFRPPIPKAIQDNGRGGNIPALSHLVDITASSMEVAGLYCLYGFLLSFFVCCLPYINCWK